MINEESEELSEQVETMSPAEELAGILRRGRENQNLSLERVAMSTKISLPFIKSLEEANYQNLPEVVFSRGFLRNLSKVYDIPSEPLLDLFHQAIQLFNETSLAREESKTRKLLTKSKATLQSDSRSKKTFRLRTLKPVPFGILILGLAVGMLGSYYYLSQTPMTVTTSKPVAKKIEQPKPEPTSSIEPVVAETKLAIKPQPEKQISNGLQKVEIVAKEKVKIKVSQDGGTWKTQTLEPANHLFEFTNELDLHVYDTSAVEIFYNGKKTGNLGPAGTVKKLNFQLNQGRMAKKQSTPDNN